MEYEIYHHGILGMHWGIRRYQNKDGSLTEEGRKRYSSEQTQYKKAEAAVKKFYDDFSKDKKKVAKHLEYSTFWDGVPTPFEDEPDYDYDKYLPKMVNDKDCIDLAYTNLLYGRHDDEQSEKDLAEYTRLMENYYHSIDKLLSKKGK